MKKTTIWQPAKIITLLITAIVFYSNTLRAQGDTTRKLITVSVSIGLVSGNDYGSSLKDALSYYKLSGYLGWISLGLGFDVNLSNNFSISPNANVLYSPVKTYSTIGGGTLPGTESANLLILPGVSAKYHFYVNRNNSIFISPGISASIGSSDFDEFKYKANGPEKELFLGYEHTSGYRHRKNKVVRAGAFGFKIGYISAPVTVTDSNNNTTQSKNFGGYGFSLYSCY